MNVTVLAYNINPKVEEALSIISDWATQNEVQIWLPHWLNTPNHSNFENVHEKQLQQADLIFSIGGDGTFLSAARLVAGLETPILGIHTGTIGFLTDFSIEALPKALLEINNNSYKTVPRLMLDVQIWDENNLIGQHQILNEIHIRPSHGRSMLQLQASLGKEYLTDYWADSLLVTTPTGSTAYNLSAGGPLLYPSCEDLILNPVNPPSLSVRPMVVPASIDINLSEIENFGCRLMLDGRQEVRVSPNQKIKVCRSKWRTIFIKSSRYGFVNALREKLGWSGHLQGINDAN